jgi:cell division transport system permease protein
MFPYLHNHFQAFIRGLIRIKSNIGSSIIMFIVIGISLCLPSAGYLIVENVRQISTKVQHEAEISIFLKKDITQEQISFIDSALKNSSEIKKIHFEPKLLAWEKLQAKLKLTTLDIGASENPLPDGFFITLNTLSNVKINGLIDSLKVVDGVDNIVVDGSWIKKLRAIIFMIKIGRFSLGGLLVIVLIVIISNTIRLQTLTFQEEILVSKLIGATNSFIHRPFMYTGLIYGLGGSLVTISILKAMVITFNRAAERFEYILGNTITLKDLPVTDYTIIIFAAMFIGLFASFFAARQSIKKLEKSN